MPLHLNHRPPSLESFLGNEPIKDSLTSIFTRDKDIPHAYLLHGPSGMGKTTLGRIISTMLGCSEMDFREYNTSNTRGIDTIREIIANSHYAPTDGDVKVYLLEECFHKDTLISTPKGDTKIEKIIPGDFIYNLEGVRKVKKKFKNRVLLSKVICIHLSNNEKIIGTKDHLFFTDSGWKEAQFLTKNDLIFSVHCDTMLSNKHLMKEKINYERKKMSGLFKNIYSKIWKRYCMLQQNLCGIITTEKDYRNNALRMVQERYESHCFPQTSSSFLFPELCFSLSTKHSAYKRSFKIRGEEKKNHRRSQTNRPHNKKESGSSLFNANEKEQPCIYAGCCRKGNGYEKNQRHNGIISIKREREQRRYHGPGEIIVDFFRRTMGISLCSKNISGEKSSWISDLLQNRCRKQNFETCNRSGWLESFFTWKKGDRQKEGEFSQRTRVESIEIYKSGSNDRSFEGFIGDKERNQGFVDFYDLEIEGHPSYFANGVLVHNCHGLTKDAQNSLLRILEDCPKHVYFILCTTEPEKLLKTIHTRCSTYRVKPLTDKQTKELLKDVLKKEGVKDFPEKVIDEIVRISEGCPRQALVTLDQVIDIDDDEKAFDAVSAVTIGEAEVIDLCRALMKGSNWKSIKDQVALLVKNNEPEKIRYAVLGYLSAVLLDQRNFGKPADFAMASALIDLFSDNTYSSGKAGIINAIYIASPK